MEDLLTLLEDVLGDSEKKSHGNYRFQCPISGCSSVRKRLEIQTEVDEDGHNPWKCWVCLKGGLSIRSLFRQAKIDPRYYQRLNGIFNYKTERHYDKDTIMALPQEFKSLLSVKQSDIVGRHALAYLKKRGFTPEMIAKYQLGYCEEGRYKNRIIIPSFDASGYLNYFAGRSIFPDDNMRYMYPEAKRGDIIPFELYINWNAPIILCEGFFDAIAILRNVIPLLEKGITQRLLSKILGSEVDKIYLAGDRDAMKETLSHCDMLMSNGKTVYLAELDQKDPGEMGFDDFTLLIQQSKALTPESLFLKKMTHKLS